jgi:periplasmic divalent cation tolerance protein
MDEVLVVLTNLPNLTVAKTVARYLVGQRMAACVNIQPGVKSYYHWKGAIRQANEVTLLVKTTRDRYPEVESAIKALSPHDLPEIIALPVSQGLPAYLEWVHAETHAIAQDNIKE